MRITTLSMIILGVCSDKGIFLNSWMKLDDKTSTAIYPKKKRLFTHMEASNPAHVIVLQPKLDISKLPVVFMTRKKNHRLFSPDFTFHASPAINNDSGELFWQFDLNEQVSWVYSQVSSQMKNLKGYLPTKVAPTKAVHGGCLVKVFHTGTVEMCDSINEKLVSTTGMVWSTRLWLNHAPHAWGQSMVGVVGASRFAGWFSNIILMPHGERMAVIVNPPPIQHQICRGGHMHYSNVVGDGSQWRFEGKIGIVDGLGAAVEVILSTVGPLQLTTGTFEAFRQSLRIFGTELMEGFGANIATSCKHKASFPSIGVEIGGFRAIIPPNEYVYTSSKLSEGQCFIDIAVSKTGSGPLKLGPIFTRNVVTHLDNLRGGFCHAA
jgi:hypothetical protein